MTTQLIYFILYNYDDNVLNYLVEQSELSSYTEETSFECLECAEGCDSCEDASPCIADLNWHLRTIILILACCIIGFLPPAGWFTFRYQQVKVSFSLHPVKHSDKQKFNVQHTTFHRFHRIKYPLKLSLSLFHSSTRLKP